MHKKKPHFFQNILHHKSFFRLYNASLHLPESMQCHLILYTDFIPHYATMQNARFFRIDEKLGSIEKGKIADMVLVKGNPLKKISDARNVVKVMLNGSWVR